MSALFRANIENNANADGWVIRLTDTVMDRVEICQNLDEFAQHIETMGDEYGGDIQVLWSKDEDVNEAHFNEIYADMARFQGDGQ
ncbi:MAG: hypothetical protein JXQ76_03950 [Campylobacterales bacterium]|nr:hypothetical protein [Campylobacterales bacterium]